MDASSDIAHRTRRHVDRRLMPFVFLLYLIHIWTAST